MCTVHFYQNMYSNLSLHHIHGTMIYEITDKPLTLYTEFVGGAVMSMRQNWARTHAGDFDPGPLGELTLAIRQMSLLVSTLALSLSWTCCLDWS